MDTNELLDRLTEAIPDRIADPVSRMGRWERGAGVLSALIFTLVAIDPAAAATTGSDYCSPAVTAMFNMAFGLTFGYAREIFIIVILASGFLVLSNGLSSAQGVIGLGIFAIAIIVLIAYMLTIDFVTFGFEQMDAPPSCTGQFSEGTGSGGGDSDGDGGSGSLAVISTIFNLKP